jgi:hypothetical protein
MPETGKAVSQTYRHLLIRTVPEGFQFGRSTPGGNVVQKLKLYASIDFPDLLEKYLRENNWLNRADLKVTLIDFSDRFMILPNQFTDDEALEDLFRFQNGEDEEQQTYMGPLDDDQQTFCWQIATSRDEQFEKLFLNLNLLTGCYILANWTLNQAIASQTTLLTAYFYARNLQVFVANSERLIFANTFVARDDEEILYFLLRCVDQLDLDPRTLIACFCCENGDYDEMQALFEPYLANIIPGEFTFQPDAPFVVRPIQPDEEEDDESEEDAGSDPTDDENDDTE